MACTAFVILGLGMAVGSLAALSWGLRSGESGAVGVGAFGVPVSLLLVALWAKSAIDDFRNPTPYGDGWEWF